LCAPLVPEAAAGPRASMNRVLVIGTGGTGKTTLARRLAERTGLPLIHLDLLYWRPGWQPTPNDEWRQTVERLITAEKWIIDGNYGGTLDRGKRVAILRTAREIEAFIADVPDAAALRSQTAARLEPGS